ncbi:cytochrome P450 [Apiospora marii]|uniref:Cytochrome P450 n=1 Tax=Apiospora marii TaxID=335849 RepID=A0ABR1SH67_9PEZI
MDFSPDLQASASAHGSLASTHASTTFGRLVICALLLPFLYWLLLPKPLRGIPYNRLSVRKILGDIPALVSHVLKEKGTFTTYLLKTVEALDSPVVQVFIKPLGRPQVVLADFQEAQKVLGHRGREFDRSSSLGDLVSGIGPDHHVLLKTNNAWRAQRRLIQDLMTTAFLNSVAGPVMHGSMVVLLDIWREKAGIANGRPWDARDDINWETLDAVHAFSYGADFGHSSSKPMLELLKSLDSKAIEKLRGTGSIDDPITFPSASVDDLCRATITLSHTTMEVHGSPMPSLHWAYIMRKPRVKRATKIKEAALEKEVTAAVSRLADHKGGKVKSAVDHMVIREKALAEKEGRKPNYYSRVMMDEVFGFVVAGHDTTSTTMCWAVKHLADNQDAQAQLREVLTASYPAAVTEGRSPDIGEITGVQIPYLDAFLEEVMRCANTVPVVDRQAIVDTQLLGHRIPKGTVVSCLVTGPSMTTAPFEIDEARRYGGNTSSKSNNAQQQQEARLSWDPYDMAAFKPERWLVDGKFDAQAGPQLAFGLGTRQCYGKRLAYLKLRIGIVLLVWHFKTRPVPAALGGQESVMVMSNEPRNCFMRLEEIPRVSK